ncbi:unnamed protein product (macronuclear) [Paramecium tetraurelia]|uniref:Uncharacterized protein n=1 Tax=Paramecium tetraurelia TaxID=5888 RepID=A0CNQ8_PARTE|nr:uncharacterized protein GSPATT00008867001 [Paramecium tetraurelia]CAK72425.1 unnamed protein product [Paramecium tetraurelia]|eukprot:XP_001439822.1 hypothetical protein (macronuclear) [Paramecium tetraurelia strain d4-2]
MNKVFLPKRRKFLQCHETTVESQLQTTRSVASTNHDVPRILIKTEESEGVSIPKDARLKNWNDVFGDFLSEALLRRKQTQLKRNTETAIDRAYLHEVPLQIHNAMSISPSIRSNFTKYIMGEISAEEFVIRKNQSQKLDKLIPAVIKKQKRPKINVTYRRSAVTDEGNHDVAFLKLLDQKNEEMLKKQQALDRFDMIRDLIEEKIEKREKEDLVKRSRELKNVGMIKQMYDISDQYIQNLQKKSEEKDISTNNRLIFKGSSVNIIKHQNPYQLLSSRNHQNPNKVKYEAPQQKHVIRHLVNKKAKQYMEELLIKDYIESQKAKKQIYVNYQFKKNIEQKLSTPQTFDQSQQNNIKHIYPFLQKGVKGSQFVKNQLINNDLELIQYITNYPKYDPYKDKDVQQQIQEDILIAGGLSSNRNIKLPLRKPAQSFKQQNLRHVELNASQDSRTDDESLNSMYEFNVDNLYQQSKKLQEKLLEKQYTDGFSKTIRAIQKNQQLKNDIILKNIQKLEGISPI